MNLKVENYSGLCEQYMQSPDLTPSGLNFLFRTRPRTLWQQDPPESVFIPEITQLSPYVMNGLQNSSSILQYQLNRWDWISVNLKG